MSQRVWIRHVEHPATRPNEFVAWVELGDGRMLALGLDGGYRVVALPRAKVLMERIEVSNSWVIV